PGQRHRHVRLHAGADPAPGPVTSAAPLDGYRVIDLSSGIPGGYATKVLADAGAEVVKVEAPEGDFLRRWSSSGAPIDPGDDSALFQFLAGSKAGVGVDPAGDLDQA